MTSTAIPSRRPRLLRIGQATRPGYLNFQYRKSPSGATLDAVSFWEPDPARLGTRHVQVFLPSVDRYEHPIPKGQEYWVEECLRVMGTLFGGATAFPPARGVWRDDEQDRLIYDNTVIVFSYVAESDMTRDAAHTLHHFLMRLGRETNQGEVGIFVDGEYRGFTNFDTDERED